MKKLITKTNVVEANEFRLVDGDGCVRMVMGSEPMEYFDDSYFLRFFDDRGYDIYRSIDSDTETKDVRESFVDKVTERDNAATLYAEDMVGRNLPGGSYALLRSQFRTNSGRWRKWAESGAFERTHVRDGRSWILGETRMPYSIRDIYLEQLNNFATSFPDEASSSGDMIQTLYLNGW